MSRWDGLRALMALLDRSHADVPATGLSDASTQELGRIVPSVTIALFTAATSTVTEFREWPRPSGLVSLDAPPSGGDGTRSVQRKHRQSGRSHLLASLHRFA